MKTIFHAWLYGKFIDIQSNLSRKKLHRMNQGSNFLGCNFSNWDNVRVPIQFRRESQPQHPDDFSSRIDPTNPDMKTIFHAWLYDKFIEIQSNLSRKKLHRMNQGSNFFGGSFSNRDNLRVPIQFRRESQPQHQDDFPREKTQPFLYQ